MDIRLPNASDRTSVIGRTGSGKTQFGMWLLSTQSFDTMPWVIIDYKGDELIGKIAGIKPITYKSVPEKPGLYLLKVLPDEESELSDFFRKVWERGGIGIYIDEGYMIGQRDKWFNSCLTQGRSKRIPMIILSQRPLWLSRFVFSESSYFFVFDLTDNDDIKRVRSFVRTRSGEDIGDQMPPYHSRYYDVSRRYMAKLGPVPSGEKILALIERKIPKEKTRFL